MEDFLIFLGLVLAVILFLFGFGRRLVWPFYVTTAIFLILGAGILLTGWETYANGTITVTDTSATVSQITFAKVLYPATLETNPLIWLLGLMCIALSLGSTFYALHEASLNATARRTASEYGT